MNQEFLVNYCVKLQPDVCLEIINDLMKNRNQNLQVVVQVCIKVHDQVGALKLIEMFESFSSFEGVYYFLGAVLGQIGESQPDVIFKYITAAGRLGESRYLNKGK
jgi:clathrin heavy chain